MGVPSFVTAADLTGELYDDADVASVVSNCTAFAPSCFAEENLDRLRTITIANKPIYNNNKREGFFGKE